MLAPFAKYGEPWLMLRLSEKVALLLKRGAKLWLHPVDALRPEFALVSIKPKSWWESELPPEVCTLKFSRSLLLIGALNRTPTLWLLLGLVMTNR